MFWLVFDALVLALEIGSELYAIWPEYNICLVYLLIDCLDEELIGSGNNIKADLISQGVLSKD